MVFCRFFYHSFVGGFDFGVNNIAIASVFMYSASSKVGVSACFYSVIGKVFFLKPDVYVGKGGKSFVYCSLG
jgi:hypothetical protein